jgi:hypothetical protein
MKNATTPITMTATIRKSTTKTMATIVQGKLDLSFPSAMACWLT